MIINHEKTSDESEISDSSTNPRTSFRVSICLRRYFKDHRARCYMQVTRNRRVRWLEKRIQKVFSLSQIFCLCSNGHLLPSTEPLAMLDPGDCIEVIPLKENKEKDLNMKNGRLNDTMVISDTTQPILTEYSTPFGYEITQNNALILDNVNINQNSEKVVEKNSTKLSSSIEHNKNFELIAHNMVTNLPESNSLFNNQKDIYKHTTYDEVDTAIHNEVGTLQQMKQHALQLVDGQCGAMSSSQPRRVRRRVRRRTRRADSPPSSLAAPLPPPPIASAPQTPHLRFSSPTPTSQSLSPVRASRCSSPLDVARNEEVSARLPRVIRPLGVDD